MALNFAKLTSRRVIRVGGLEAESFLQGLISNDIGKATPGRAIFAALLSAQGKIQFDFIVLKDRDGSCLIDAEAARAQELIKKLKLYKLRAKVTIEPSDLGVFAAFGRELDQYFAETRGDTLSTVDPRTAKLGKRFYLKVDRFADAPQSLVKKVEEADFAAERLDLGVPEGAQELGIEKLFLLEANFEELNGVDFKKGCYVGQELTARMKHKSELKKRLLPFRVSGSFEPGATLASDGRELGPVIGRRDDVAFALVRLDRLAEAGAADLRIGGAEAKLIRPAYLAHALA